MIEVIEQKIRGYQENGKTLFTTSSFQTHSLVMLHLISRIDRNIPVYFINTGYLFPETVSFKTLVAEKFGLEVHDVRPGLSKMMQKDQEGRLLFVSDPDRCCFHNKVEPMNPLLAEYDIWINGIRADQNSNRKSMREEEEAPFDSIRYHPMLAWTNKMIFDYIREFDLPRHPLDKEGYTSIGCEPCTRKPDLEMMERESRWLGMNKTECGLHTELIKK